MNDKINKVQINKVTKWGTDRYGKKISETTQMFNIRTDDVEEAVKLYYELLDKFYASKPKVEEE